MCPFCRLGGTICRLGVGCQWGGGLRRGTHVTQLTQVGVAGEGPRRCPAVSVGSDRWWQWGTD